MSDKVSDLHGGVAGADPRQKELADRVARATPGDGVHTSAYAPLSLIRASAPQMALPTVYQPSLCFVVQGSKRALLRDDVYHYDALNYLVVSVTLPMCGQILEASPEQPYLCARLELDAEEIRRLCLQLGKQMGPRPTGERAVYVARMGEPLLDAMLRLVRLLDTPDELAVLAPMALREIYYRVLLGELGHRLVDLIEGGGQLHRIAQAIEWLKQRFAEPLRIEDLAALVHLSPSALHHRFKAVTAMSPLQFQKQLRLHEARRLMFAEGLDCASAGHRVGYESPSQFSREYRRLFGAPPRTEIQRLRETAAA